jgi:dTDP-4-dehydrorhamnose reductase
MKVLIVGASGLVGGNIYNYFSSKTDWKLTGTYNNYQLHTFDYLDASDPKTWSSKIVNTKWDVIIHTGALTHVDKCELEPQLSEYLTVKSTQNLVLLANRNQSKIVYISTDYVFDGKNGPYVETDTESPLCVYGHHKLQAETLIKNETKHHLIIRVTNVYGNEIRNKNFLSRTIKQLETEDSISISAPNDQFSTPVNAWDIAQVIYLLIRDNKVGTYHIASTDFLSRVQFLNRINLYFCQKLSIKPVDTKSLNQTAKRPLKGGLIAEKFLSEYPDFVFSNVDDYLKNL